MPHIIEEDQHFQALAALSRAFQKFEQGKMMSCQIYLEQSLSLHPQMAISLNLYVKIIAESDDIEPRLQFKRIKKVQKQLILFRDQTSLQHIRNTMRQAAEYLNNAQKLNVKQWLKLMHVFIVAEDVTAAEIVIRYCETASKLQKHNLTKKQHFDLAIVYFELEALQKAMVEFKMALGASDLDDIKCLNSLATLNYLRGQYLQCLWLAKKAEKLLPNNDDSLHLKSIANSRMGQTSQSLQIAGFGANYRPLNCKCAIRFIIECLLHFDSRITEAKACVVAMVDLFEKPYILMKGHEWHIYKSMQFISKYMGNPIVTKDTVWQAYLLLLDDLILAGLKQKVSMRKQLRALQLLMQAMAK